MIWSIKMICSSSFSGYYQYLLVFTYRTSSRCSSKKLVASTHCLYIDKYCFCPSLWSWITIQGSLIFGSNTAVSDMLYEFWAATCWSDILKTYLHMKLEVYHTNQQHYLLGASKYWFSSLLTIIGLLYTNVASVVHDYQMYDHSIKSQHVVCPSS